MERWLLIGVKAVFWGSWFIIFPSIHPGLRLTWTTNLTRASDLSTRQTSRLQLDSSSGLFLRTVRATWQKWFWIPKNTLIANRTSPTPGMATQVWRLPQKGSIRVVSTPLVWSSYATENTSNWPDPSGREQNRCLLSKCFVFCHWSADTAPKKMRNISLSLSLKNIQQHFTVRSPSTLHIFFPLCLLQAQQ